MSTPGQTPTQGTSLFGWLFAGHRTRKTFEDRELLRIERRDSSGRTSLKRFKVHLRELANSYFLGILLIICIELFRVDIRHVRFLFDPILFGILGVGPLLHIRIPAVRRLHDVGISGEFLWRPWVAIQILKLPSAPPNKWGEAPDLLVDRS
jgi:hypothetical protein